MTQTSFEDGVAAIAAAETDEGQTNAVVETTETIVATREQFGGPMSDFRGEIDRSDIDTPRLAIAQSIGPLSEDFPPGSVVLNKSVPLAAKEEPVEIVVVTAHKYLQEDLDYDDSDLPRRFESFDAAKSAGLTVEWTDGNPPQVKPCLDVYLLVRAGKVDSPEFGFEYDGDKFATAVWSITSFNAYKHAAKKLLTARALYMREGFNSASWILKTEKIKMKNGNSTFIPTLTRGQATTPEFRAWSSQLF